MEDINRKRVPVDGNVLWQEALSLYEDFQKKDRTEEETKPFTACEGWLHSFRNRFNLKNIEILGEVASAGREAAATFPVDKKKNYQGRKMRS